MISTKEIVKLLTPPILLDAVAWITKQAAPNRPPFEGPLSSWAEAVARSDGWDAQIIIDKTLDASLKVKHGSAIFQQDTIIHTKIIYSETILAFIAIAASMSGGRLNIIDFGGALGTNFYQNKRILHSFIKRKQCTWNIIERPTIAQLGRDHFEDASLRFFSSLDEALESLNEFPGVFLFSGSLQCVDEPIALLDRVIGCGVKVIAFDRLLVSPNDRHEIFVQHPDAEKYYAASYPSWCFSRLLFLENLQSKGFAVVEDFTKHPKASRYHCGMIFERIAA